MKVLNLADLKDSFVIHYGGQLHQVNAHTFANSLLSLSSLLDIVNQEINPDSSITINIQALGEGSFRAKISPSIKSIGGLLKGLIKKDTVLPITISLLTYIQGLKHNGKANFIIVNGDEVVINGETNQVVLPKALYDEGLEYYKRIPTISQSVNRTFEILEDDPAISEFGIAKDIYDKDEYGFYIRRDKFEDMIVPSTSDPDKIRVIEQDCILTIIKTVLERKKRKWEFVWQGIKISAIITDSAFYDRLEKRQISFRHGDIMNAKMKITQELDMASGVYLNREYEIVRVLEDPHGAIIQDKLRLDTKN